MLAKSILLNMLKIVVCFFLDVGLVVCKCYDELLLALVGAH